MYSFSGPQQTAELSAELLGRQAEDQPSSRRLLLKGGRHWGDPHRPPFPFGAADLHWGDSMPHMPVFCRARVRRPCRRLFWGMASPAQLHNPERGLWCLTGGFYLGAKLCSFSLRWNDAEREEDVEIPGPEDEGRKRSGGEGTMCGGGMEAADHWGSAPTSFHLYWKSCTWMHQTDSVCIAIHSS